MRMASGWFAMLLAMTALGGCADEQLVGENGFYAFAMTGDTPPSFEGEEGEQFFLVEERIEFPITVPTDAEMANLEALAPAPYPRAPWVERDDYTIEVDWLLINLDDARRDVTVTVNGFNEFHEYLPSFQIIDDEAVADFSQWERAIRLEPLERLTGTIREQELDEVTVDLATVVNGAPNPHLVVHPENQQTDPRVAPFIPEVIPGLTGIRMGLRATGAGNILIELTIRIRDRDGKVVKDVDDAWLLPVPAFVIPAELLPPEM